MRPYPAPAEASLLLRARLAVGGHCRACHYYAIAESYFHRYRLELANRCGGEVLARQPSAGCIKALKRDCSKPETSLEGDQGAARRGVIIACMLIKRDMANTATSHGVVNVAVHFAAIGMNSNWGDRHTTYAAREVA